MATTASTRAKRPQITPSLVKSETFLFALLVVGLAIYVPFMLQTGRGSDVRYANATIPLDNVRNSAGSVQPPLVIPPVSGPVIGARPAQDASVTSTGEQRTAPITYIAPYLVAFGRGILSFIGRLPVFIYRILRTAVFRPLSYPLALILAVLRPITLLLEVIYAVLLRTPLAVLSWFIREAIYPLYVFTGIAAILGLTFGYSASHVPRVGIFITEHIRSRIGQSTPGPPALLVQPPSGEATPRRTSYPSRGSSFRKTPSIDGPSRSVTFNNVDDDDDTLGQREYY